MRIALDVKFGSTVLSNVKATRMIFGYYNGGTTDPACLTVWMDQDAATSNTDILIFYDGFKWSDNMVTTNSISDVDVSTRNNLIIQRGTCNWGSYTCTTLDNAITVQTPATGMAIFAAFNAGNYQIFGKRDMYLYSVKIYDSNSELIHNLIPVKRNADDEPGLYDLKTYKFYTNMGTGVFTVGSDVGPVPSDDQIISAKLGDGLSFDSNGAITADSITPQYVRVNTSDSYVLLHTKPSDWDDSWYNYYTLEYDELTTSPPDWDPTKHYKYENDNYVLGSPGDTFVSTTWYDKHYKGLDPNTPIVFDSDVYYTDELHLIEDGETFDTAFKKVNEAIEHIERLEQNVQFLHDNKVDVRETVDPERIEFYYS